MLVAREPGHIPPWAARIAVGPFGVAFMTELRGADNRRARRRLAWAPGHPSWREGLTAELARPRTRHDRRRRRRRWREMHRGTHCGWSGQRQGLVSWSSSRSAPARRRRSPPTWRSDTRSTASHATGLRRSPTQDPRAKPRSSACTRCCCVPPASRSLAVSAPVASAAAQATSTTSRCTRQTTRSSPS